MPLILSCLFYFDILSLSFMDLVFSCESLQCLFLAVTHENLAFSLHWQTQMENKIFEFAEDGQQAKSVQEEASLCRKKQVCTRRSKFVQEEKDELCRTYWCDQKFNFLIRKNGPDSKWIETFMQKFLFFRNKL